MQPNFQLGPWRVEPQLNNVVCDQGTIHLEPKMMEVLVCLAQRSGEVVPKEQLVQEVWRDTFVTDDVLIRCISELRKVFSDKAGKRTVIETIPKRGYRLLITAVPVTQANRLESSLIPEFVDSIAVLPFENIGSDPEMEYLSDGVAETIINNLSRLQDLRVVPRTTTFEYKRKCLNPTQVGRELAARLVLTGRVTQRGDRLFVGAELIDTVRQAQLWGQTYDRRVEEILTIQDEIAAQLPSYLHLRLTEVERRELTRRSTESREAYHLFLKAMYFAAKWTPDAFRKGLEFCGQAIKVDPGFADAYAALSYLYSLLGTLGFMPALEAFPKAKAAALKALVTDDRLADAHAVLGFVHLAHDWDLLNAEKEVRRAIELGPHMPGGHYAYTQLCLARRLQEEAMESAKRALDLDPLSLPKNYNLALVHYFARDYDAAVAQLHRTSELDPSFVIAHNLLAVVYAQQGKPQEAMAKAQKVLALSNDIYSRVTFGRVTALVGKQVEARQVLFEVEQTSTPPHFPRAMWCAMIHALLGEPDAAFEWLDRAYSTREPALIYLMQFPDFESLHNDPRFRDLLRRIGLAT